MIENEFGDVGIDDKLLKNENTKFKLDEELFEMMNGCICCTVRQDLVKVLGKLAERCRQGKLHLDGIIIETTGLADPAPVAQTFFVDDTIMEFARLDGIVTLVDAKHLEQHLDDSLKPEGCENEAVEQLAFADRILLNKIDLVPDEAELKRIESRIASINKFAPILRTEKAAVNVSDVLNLRAFDLTRTLDMDPGELANFDDETGGIYLSYQIHHNVHPYSQWQSSLHAATDCAERTRLNISWFSWLNDGITMYIY